MLVRLGSSGGETTDEDTVLATYTYGNDLISSTKYDVPNTIYYNYDGLGSVRQLTDDTETVVAEYTYDAFGNLIASTGTADNTYGFTGEQQFNEADNLVFLRARYYDSRIGRFISRDPIGTKGGINLYGYVGNNSTNYIDPKGLRKVCCRSVDPTDCPKGTKWLCKKFRHCHISSKCHPGEDEYDTEQDFHAFPPRYLDGDPSKPCAAVSEAEIDQCLKNNPYDAGSGKPGDNCQSNTRDRLNKCCLDSSWEPNWYGYPNKNYWGPVPLRW